MMKRLRTLVAPIVIVLLGAYGVAFAATGTPTLVSHHSDVQSTEVSPDPTETDAPDETVEPTESPEETDAPENTDAPEPTHERSTEGCPEGFDGNHGQFVSGSDDHHDAAQSECGTPVHSEEPEVSSAPQNNDDQGQDSGEHAEEHSPEPSETPEATHTEEHHGDDGTPEPTSTESHV